MNTTTIDETELARILKQAGLELAAEEVRAILPGAAIVAAMIERVRQPLPREAEPALIFEAEPGPIFEAEPGPIFEAEPGPIFEAEPGR